MVFAVQQQLQSEGDLPVVAPAGRAFLDSPPDQLAETADRLARAELGARRLEVLLADYRLSGLWPVISAGKPTSLMDGAAAGSQRCFRSQRRIVELLAEGGCRWHLPMTIWGDRIGVLRVDFDPEPAEPTLRRAQLIADELALALRAADQCTDRYRRSRRQERLSMAAELQWELLPGRALTGVTYRLAGQLEPAYTIGGDHFDWSVEDRRLIVTVLNGDGWGLSAALLTSLTVNAMRNARRAGGNLVEQAELASDTVYSHHRGERHVATLLLDVDLDSGRVRAVDAGSPRALLVRGTTVRPLEFEQQMPLGMFPETRYEEQEFDLEPGDRLFVVSDGVHSAGSGASAPYGDRAMPRAMRAARLQPAGEAVGAVMREMYAHHAGSGLRDDAVIVCLDWLGPARAEPDGGRGGVCP